MRKNQGKNHCKSGQSVKGQEICVKVLARTPEKSATICWLTTNAAENLTIQVWQSSVRLTISDLFETGQSNLVLISLMLCYFVDLDYKGKI